jgi:hypothetical protein
LKGGKPLTFFVLADDYSSKGIWLHPVGDNETQSTFTAVPSNSFGALRAAKEKMLMSFLSNRFARDQVIALTSIRQTTIYIYGVAPGSPKTKDPS